MCLDPTFKNYTFDGDKYRIDWSSDGRIRFPGDKVIMIKCNNCPECWFRSSNEWADRCYLESQEHKDNCVITLTYANTSGELCKRDYQLFLKRLRKAIYPTKIKYFISGEYGSMFGRPHYHLIIFGWKPLDCVPYRLSKSLIQMYNSPLIDSVWGKGYATVDLNVDRKACFYSAKYMQKAVSSFGVQHAQPPFVACSKGIAAAAASRYDPEKNSMIYIAGKARNAPRYFRKVFEKNNSFRAWVLRIERERRVSKTVNLLNLPIAEKYRPLFRKSLQKRESNLTKWRIFLDKIHV